MLMWLRMAPALHLIFLLIIHRVSAADWGVNYSPLHLCALKNSTMTISCTFTYPTPGYQIMTVFWNIDFVKNGVELADLSVDPEYSQRLQYLGDEQQNCTVRLSHVTKKDEHDYFFKFNTNVTKGRWTGIPGVRLSVTDLQLESPERVTEGDSVRLTCNSSCELTDTPTFIWYRNSHTLTNIGDELNIRSVSRTEAGHYSCGVQGQTYISPAVYLNVRYAPDSPVISISGSAVIMEGDSVSLNCSSDSNPPALNFSWFKGETLVGSGGIFNISKISSDDSGEYKCRARNDLGEKYSDPVTVDVQYPPRSILVSISGSAVIMSGDSVTLSCSSDSNPLAEINWFKGETYLNSERIFNISKISSDDSEEEYKCRARNVHGEKHSVAVILNGQFNQGAWRNMIIITATTGGLLFIIIIITIIMFAILSKRKSRRSAVKESVISDTYADLDVQCATPDLYNTLTTVHHRPAENSCSTLDPQSSSEHHNPPINRRRLQ
ncbi:B-cell receptor CD22-like [Danio rerio]|uniref:B-cell receptor CD22-like n=3 Tax=Danio rerio TaxID=7955 RepID=A0AC58G0G7_DANRE|nr:B-cell receptor CD22-like [Danio rerio]|eukprot:XP_009293582.1 B-cell receptor CD22-like [Danio rerio]